MLFGGIQLLFPLHVPVTSVLTRVFSLLACKLSFIITCLLSSSLSIEVDIWLIIALNCFHRLVTGTSVTIHLQTAARVKKEYTLILVLRSRARRNHQKKLTTMTALRQIKNEYARIRMIRMTTIKMITTTTMIMMMMTAL